MGNILSSHLPIFRSRSQRSSSRASTPRVVPFWRRVGIGGDQWIQLYQGGKDLCAKYEKEGQPEHLAGAISDLRSALTLRPRGDSDRSYTLSYLGSALRARYEREGDLNDLTQAIAYHQEVLTLWPPGAPNRAVALTNLANALLARYDREGDLAELLHVIEYRRQALNLCPPGHPNHSACLNNLAVALRVRYEREGEPVDLVQVIQLHQQVLDLCPPGHPDHSTFLSNLAIAFEKRYEREGEVADLMQMMRLNQEALDLCPPGHPNRSIPLSNLAHALYTRYARDGALVDLVQAIQHHKEALTLRPPGHSLRCLSLVCLANVLRARYRREGELTDLSQAIQHYEEAMSLCPPGHFLRSASLNNLATGLQARYEREGKLADLVQVIELRQQTLDLHPPDHPLHSTSLRGLADTLLLKYKSLNNIDLPHQNTPNLGSSATEPLGHAKAKSNHLHSPNLLRARIISLLREASRSNNCLPRDCLRGALRWITVSKDIDPDSTLDAYISALQQLDVVMASGQSLDQRYYRLRYDDLLRQTQGLGGDAATWALQRGELEHAVELLEQGRTILLAQVGRYRVELDYLRQVDSGLADRFADLSRQLNASVVSEKQVQEVGSTAKDEYGRFQNLSTEWDQTIYQIRMLPDFDTFLRPMPYDRLRKAAAEGPIAIIIPNESSSDALIVREDLPPHHIQLPLANSARLSQLSINFTEILNPEYDGDIRTNSLCVEMLRCLWIEVVQPIAHALQHDLGSPLHSRMWWCPTSAASFLPLHAAGLYSKTQPLENFPNLYISSYTTTFQALIRARRPTKTIAPKKLLIVSQPHTPGEPPLNHAKKEADLILETVSPVQEARMLSAEEGSCMDVQLKMEFHPWVHFICHGVQAERQPLDSYLSLYDGHLTLRNVIERNLPNADFAFLAACHSAAGDQALWDEGLHLAAAMQFAGFRGVVGTLWKMADDDGPQLAEAFYRDMIRHGDSRRAAVALSKAIKQLRRNKVPINRWMRFIHIGI